MNVAFIPIVRKTSIAGKKLPKEVVRAARRSITQKTMTELLGSLNQDLSLTLLFPDQVERAVKPVLASIVADMPEVAILSSSRMSDNTAYPCARCFIPLAATHFVDTNIRLLKTSQKLKIIYSNLDGMKTKTEVELYLKKNSLQFPPAFLMHRFEANYDSEELKRKYKLAYRKSTHQ